MYRQKDSNVLVDVDVGVIAVWRRLLVSNRNKSKNFSCCLLDCFFMCCMM